jgi:hypothetical protein
MVVHVLGNGLVAPRARNAHLEPEYVLMRLWADAHTEADIRGTR